MEHIWREVVGSDLPLDEVVVATVWRKDRRNKSQSRRLVRKFPFMQPDNDGGLDEGASTGGSEELLAGTHMLKVKLTELVDGLNIEHESVREQW